jgi:DNA-binding NtrC family response regulator
MIREKTFREDLYYRLNVASIRLPALRQRREDIPALIDHFIKMHSRKGRGDGARFSAEILAILSAYDWPGNIRELGNEVWRLVETVEGEVQPRHLSKKITSNKRPAPAGKAGSLEQMEKEILGGAIAEALEKTHGNRAQAARLLGIGRATLYRRLERYGLQCD